MEMSTAIITCVGCFLVGLLAGAALVAWQRNAKAPYVCKLLRWHFGTALVNTLVVTEREFPARIRVDLQRCLDDVIQQRTTTEFLTGIRCDDRHIMGISLSALLSYETASLAVPLEHQEFNIGESESVRCLKNALWLLKADGGKVAVLLSQVFQFNGPPKVRIDVAVQNDETGQAFVQVLFKALEDAVRKAEAYRGKVLSLEDNEEFTGESVGLTVHKLPVVQREDVVLPDTTLELLERNVLRFVEQREALTKLGQSVKKGLLFHGPPGNGKTHTIRYLISALREHTTLLITAEQAGKLGEYMNLARLLQPTLVVLEDVDLIARERTQSGSACQETLLNKLLNEMDGLKEDAEILFVLTTNRPEAIEDALASRPGRVDQVIEFPAPDENGRQKLVHLYAGAMNMPEDLLQHIVQKSEGVSAAFIKELMRRSLQFYLAEGDAKMLTAANVDLALDEMLVLGGRLNQRSLGFGNGTYAARSREPSKA